MRFALRHPCEGEFRIVHDVMIDSWSPASVWVTATTALRDDRMLRLDVGDGLEDAHDVYAGATVPIVHEGEVRHHVRLDAAGPMDGRTGPTTIGRHAFLWQRASIRLLDVSRSGCCLEARGPIPAGSAGRLEMAIDEQRVLDDIRVAWCRPIEGAGVYHLGVELFPTLRGGIREPSLRDLIAAADGASQPGSMSRTEQSAVPAGLPDCAGEDTAPLARKRPEKAQKIAPDARGDDGSGVAD